MIKTTNKKKEVCKHIIKHIKTIKNDSIIYCKICGSIGIKEDSSSKEYIYTTKYYKYKNSFEVSALQTFKKMKQKLDQTYNEREATELYKSHRNNIIKYLQSLKDKFKYSDQVYYSALYLLDNYIKNMQEKDIKKKKLDLTVLTCFILVAKFKEDNIFEPELNSIETMDGFHYLKVSHILKHEVLVLKHIQYDLSAYSVYDFLSFFMSIGFIFENEVKSNNITVSFKIYYFTKNKFS